jgi:hypothetical protein
MKAKECPTQQYLKEIFDYDGAKLIWKVIPRQNVKIGSIAGCRKDGYIVTNVKGKQYRAHRLIYTWYHGFIDKNLQIDHINGIRDDNRIVNLRLVTNQENSFNQIEAKGYYFHKYARKFHAQIMIDRKYKYLGLYTTECEARQAYLKAKDKYHIIGD